MKLAIRANDRDNSLEVKELLLEKLKKTTLTIDDENPDLVLTIGGDGTVLHAVHDYIDQLDRVVFSGIHTGHLGYYADWMPDELDCLIDFIQQEEVKTSEYPLLELTLEAAGTCQRFQALNEVTILNAHRTQHLNITIDDLFFESFRGTGVCVATPTGSTAYNKALGGALIYPSLPAFQLTEIASINNNVYRTVGSPLIIPKEQVLTLQSEDFQNVIITRDHLSTTFCDLERISLTLSNQKVRFAKRDQGLFWSRVKDHFL